MKTYELIISVDDSFTGTTQEVLEYLKWPYEDNKKLINLCRTGRKCEGHYFKAVGILKHTMLYAVLDENGIILHKGTSEELSEILFKSPATIQNAAKGKFKLDSKYRVIKIGIVDRIEEYK